MRLFYRVRQFFGGVLARVSEEDRREADAVLNSPAREWFHSLPGDLHWHGLQVMRDLKHAGVDRSDALAAALLHDAGKAAGPNGPLVRTFIVLARRRLGMQQSRDPAKRLVRELLDTLKAERLVLKWRCASRSAQPVRRR